MDTQFVDEFFANKFSVPPVEKPYEDRVDFVGGPRNRYVGAVPLKVFLAKLKTCLDGLGKWNLLPRKRLATIQDVKPYCGRILESLKGLSDEEHPADDLRPVRRMIEGLEYIQGATDEEARDIDCFFKVHLIGPPSRVRSLITRIREVSRQAEAEWLTEFAQTSGVKISQSWAGEVVLIRGGIAERTALRVTPEIERALGDNLLSNQAGREAASRWFADDVPRTSPDY
jgi:hypothetical protein